MNVNRVVITGNLTADPEVRQLRHPGAVALVDEVAAV